MLHLEGFELDPIREIHLLHELTAHVEIPASSGEIWPLTQRKSGSHKNNIRFRRIYHTE
jgi:hypothetical protein